MNAYADYITIDKESCTGCGRCVTVCPTDTIAVIDGVATVVSSCCMACDHCGSVCPEGAIVHRMNHEEACRFVTFSVRDCWVPPGTFDTGSLVELMASRRSCRNFNVDSVSRDCLTDLVKAGITAPTGTNSQAWTFTILSEREAVIRFGSEIAGFFRRVNRWAAHLFLCWLLKTVGWGALWRYRRDYYDVVREALEEWDSAGRDRLFHGAPAMIVVGSRPGASCPTEDALLATQNILLAAHTMGLGSCLIGFAVEAMRRNPAIRKSLGIPKEESVHAVIALGYSRETYHRRAGRMMPLIRFSNGKPSG